MKIRQIPTIAWCIPFLAFAASAHVHLRSPALDSARSVPAPSPIAADLVDAAAADGRFKTLTLAVRAAGLVDVLKGKGPFTLFAPTDDAFAKLPAGTLATLLKPENKNRLAAVLTHHVIAAEAPASAVKSGAVQTLNGQRLDLNVKDGSVTVDGAKVTSTDIRCSNGLIHVIDAVLVPSEKDIVDTAASAGTFRTLATLLEKADLIGALKGPGPFTVFAPTDEAFAKLPRETVDSLLKSENKAQLAAILQYHVLSGRIFSDAAAKGATVETLQGATITTASKDGRVGVNQATVVGPDIDASNGVIHVIDSVLTPPGK
jgi:hypothetical protein